VSDALLLDTHVAIWFSTGTLTDPVNELIADVAIDGEILVSPIVAWEVGQLCGYPTRSAVLGLTSGPETWFREILSNRNFRECRLDGAIALASTMLPGEFHRDPADRFLVATARALDCRLMTRDRKILAYAEQGHVKAIAC
jgi:PIN domain nuclease of toxin-antitoxin system